MKDDLEYLEFPDEISWVLHGSDESLEEPSPHEVPKILTSGEKTKLCKEFNKSRKRDFFFTFEDTNTLGDIKSDKTIAKIKSALDLEGPSYETKMKREVTNMAIGVTKAGRYRKIEMAIKITGSVISAGTIMTELYEMFPDFHGEIGFSDANNHKYMEKARRIVAPRKRLYIDGHTKPVDIDMQPRIFGETLHGLLNRMQNAIRKQEAPRKNVIHPLEIPKWIHAAKQSKGSWSKMMVTSQYMSSGWDNPLFAREYFDHYAYEIGPYSFSEEVLGDVMNGEDWNGVELESGQQMHDWSQEGKAVKRMRECDSAEHCQSLRAFRESCKPTVPVTQVTNSVKRPGGLGGGFGVGPFRGSYL